MRDIHSHLLPNVDDGVKTLEQCEELLKMASESGITDIMFTPHYIIDSKYTSDKNTNINKINGLTLLAKDKYNINVFLGNEVYITTEIIDLYKSGKISTLNDSKYMLIEIPLNSKINNLKSILFELINSGVKPILAHPERYTSYYKDYSFFESLKSMGILFQVNYVSILGDYGIKAKKMAKYFLKNNMVDFLGSDIHSPRESKYINLNKALSKIKKLTNEETFINITENNFAKVIYNEEI